MPAKTAAKRSRVSEVDETRRGDVQRGVLQTPGAQPEGFGNERNIRKVAGPFLIEKMIILHK
jgi:hypothetical protein